MEFRMEVNASPNQVFDLLHQSVAAEARRLTGKEVSLYRIRKGFSYRFELSNLQPGSFLVTAFSKPASFATRLNLPDKSSQFHYEITPTKNGSLVVLKRQDFKSDGTPIVYNSLQTLSMKRDFMKGIKQGLKSQGRKR